jgi:cytochrome c oxidase cbb3-type subunit I/II
MKSYSVYAGVQDALVQWWSQRSSFPYNTFLGLISFQSGKSSCVLLQVIIIVHFWSLIFIYIWAGPHHLLYSALPNWAQNLGVAFSTM